MKVLALLIVALALIDSYVQSAAVVRSGMLPHNLFECDPSKPRIRVLQKVIQKPGRTQTIINDALQYPPSPEPFTTRVISCIQIDDLSRSGKGGYADIVAGGVGFNFVSISFESQRGEDIQFAVTIYAYYTSSPGIPLLSNGQATPAAK